MSELDTQNAFSLDSQDSLSHMRDRFISKEPEMIYLDGNSLGRLPRTTIGRMQRVVEHEWGERLIRSWNEGWFELQQKLGAKIAQIIGAEPDEVVVADSTSVNFYKLAIAALMAQPGRHKIITDDLNFPSDLYILQGITGMLGNQHQIQVVSAADGVHGPADALAAALDYDTALLTLSHTVFKSGYLYDMAALTARAHEVGALTLWDLSHSVGAVPVNLGEAKADLAVGCTYKYLNGGPGSPAFLYVRRSLQAQLGNPISGWFGQKNMFDFGLDYQPDSGIRRFLTGTPPLLSLTAVEPGVDLILEATMKEIRQKSLSLTEYFISLYDRYLAPLGFRLNSPRSPRWRGSHVSIGHDDGWRINKALIEEMHVLPDFREPDNLRFGFAPLYTSYTDVHTAVMRLRAVVQDGLHERYPAERPAVT